jgi:hypothetical protein
MEERYASMLEPAVLEVFIKINLYLCDIITLIAPIIILKNTLIKNAKYPSGR